MRIVTFAILMSLSLAGGASGAPPEKVGRALVTFYWLIDETASRYRGKDTVTLEDARGRVIARTTSRFRRELIMEGSGRLCDGRTVEYDRKSHGKNRFRIARSKFGGGKLGCALVPYRTIAVDPHFIKLGSTVSIPQLKGAQLPDGTIHDGIFMADDRGHFRGAHIDFFIGAGAKGARPFIRKGYGSRSHVTAYLVGDESPDQCRRTGHSSAP